MTDIKTVILPLDGSELAETALPFASELVRLTGAELVVLRVLEELKPIYDIGRHEVVWIDPEQHRAELISPEILDGPISRLRETGIEARAVVRIGDPRREILAEAESYEAPAITLASHGRGGLGRTILGSVANGVIQGSTCPVLIIRPEVEGQEQAAGPRHLPFRRITVPLDGSDIAEGALPLAVQLAKAANGRLHVIRVAETYRDELRDRPTGIFDPPSHQSMLQHFERLENESSDYLRTVTAQLQQHAIPVTWELLSGDAASQILNYVERDDPDLIIMTTRGRGGLTRWIFGSVADRLITAVKTPLLVIRVAEEV